LWQCTETRIEGLMIVPVILFSVWLSHLLLTATQLWVWWAPCIFMLGQKPVLRVWYVLSSFVHQYLEITENCRRLFGWKGREVPSLFGSLEKANTCDWTSWSFVSHWRNLIPGVSSCPVIQLAQFNGLILVGAFPFPLHQRMKTNPMFKTFCSGWKIRRWMISWKPVIQYFIHSLWVYF